MIKPADYDKTEVFSDFQALPPGGYVCRIVKLEETKSQNTGNDMIKAALDIAEGEEAERFFRQFRSDTRDNKKWPCVYNQTVYNKDGSTNKGFKTFVEHVRESNAGFEPQWNEAFAAGFKDKLIGMVFGREEYEGYDGKRRWSTKPMKTKPVEDIRSGNFTVPADKPLEDGIKASVPEGFEEITDDDIPF